MQGWRDMGCKDTHPRKEYDRSHNTRNGEQVLTVTGVTPGGVRLYQFNTGPGVLHDPLPVLSLLCKRIWRALCSTSNRLGAPYLCNNPIVWLGVHRPCTVPSTGTCVRFDFVDGTLLSADVRQVRHMYVRAAVHLVTVSWTSGLSDTAGKLVTGINTGPNAKYSSLWKCFTLVSETRGRSDTRPIVSYCVQPVPYTRPRVLVPVQYRLTPTCQGLVKTYHVC